MRVNDGEPYADDRRIADSRPNEPPACRHIAGVAREAVTGNPVTVDPQTAASKAWRSPRSRSCATTRSAAGGLRRPLSRREANVELIRERIIAAGAIALMLAAIGGYSSHARRRPHQGSTGRAQGGVGRLLQPDPGRLGRRAASSRRRSTTCSASSLGSTRRASSSSPPRRTSCTPIFSLGGILSCSRTRSSTRRRAPSSSTSCAARSPHAQAATELLDLSRLESGALELRPEPTDVGQLAREVAASSRPAVTSPRRRAGGRTGPRTRSRSTATLSGSRRSCGSCSTTRSCTRRRARPSGFRPRARTGSHPGGRRLRASASAIDHAAHLRALLHLRRRRAGAGLRPRDRAASWRSRCAAS